MTQKELDAIKEMVKKIRREKGEMPQSDIDISNAYIARGCQIACEEMLSALDAMSEKLVEEQ